VSDDMFVLVVSHRERTLTLINRRLPVSKPHRHSLTISLDLTLLRVTSRRLHQFYAHLPTTSSHSFPHLNSVRPLTVIQLTGILVPHSTKLTPIYIRRYNLASVFDEPYKRVASAPTLYNRIPQYCWVIISSLQTNSSSQRPYLLPT